MGTIYIVSSKEEWGCSTNLRAFSKEEDAYRYSGYLNYMNKEYGVIYSVDSLPLDKVDESEPDEQSLSKSIGIIDNDLMEMSSVISMEIDSLLLSISSKEESLGYINRALNKERIPIQMLVPRGFTGRILRESIDSNTVIVQAINETILESLVEQFVNSTNK